MSATAVFGTAERAAAKVRVLIADDVAEVRMLMRLTLERQGFEVVGEAVNGAEAIALADAYQPEVVLLDVAMPVMDGLEALHELRRRTPGLPVVMHSGFNDSSVSQHCLKAGAAAYTVKGDDALVLGDVLREAAAGARCTAPQTLTSESREAAAQDVTVPPRASRDPALLLVSDRAAVPIAIALFAVIFVARHAFGPVDDGDAVAILYVAPISLLAGRYGIRGGMAGVAAAVGLVGLSLAVGGTRIGALGFGTRLVAFLVIGIMVGVFADRVRGLLDYEKRASAAIVSANRQLGETLEQARTNVVALEESNDDLHRARLELETAMSAQRASERLYRTAVDGAPIGMALVSLAGRFMDVNAALCHIVGYTREQLLALTFAEITVEADLAADLAQAQELAAGHIPSYSMEKRYIKADGSIVWIRLHGSLVRADDGSPLHFIAQIEDINEAKAHQVALEHLTLSDPLTDLANRLCVMDRLDRAVSRQARHGGTLAMLLIDLDHFKNVNDTLGHHAGDLLLQGVGDRLRPLARVTDTVGRLGGDEFVVLLEQLDSSQDAEDVARRVIAALSEPFTLEQYGAVHVGATVGVAVLSEPGTTPEALYRRTDAALYEAKGRGRGRVGVYDTVLHASVRTRHETETALRTALATDAVTVHYRPMVDLATMRVVAVEALARMQDSSIRTEVFVAIAEETGLVIDLDTAVLRQVRHDFGHTGAAHGSLLDVHVNVSAHSLASPVWQAAAAGIADDPVRVALEVTERILLFPSSSATAEIDRLAKGVRVGLDDFGTGFSALSIVHQRPLSFLKLDRSFTASLPDNKRARSVVAGVLTLARGLGLSVVAEGVETQDQLDTVRELGCDSAQGYLLGPPMPLAELAALLTAAERSTAPTAAAPG